MRAAIKLLCAVAIVTVLCGPAFAANERIALVVGVAHYQNFPEIPNAANDAHRIADALRLLGFAVDERVDPDIYSLKMALRNFGIRADGANNAVVFFTGRGIQDDQENYLMPSDAVIQRERDLQYEALDLDLVLGEVSRAKRAGIVILDASHEIQLSSPKTRAIAENERGLGSQSRAIGSGLARVDKVPRNTAVILSAKPGQVSIETKAPVSPFVAALLTSMKIPGLEFGLFFKAVQDAVLKATDYRQEPVVYSALGSEDFYFNPPLPSTDTTVAAVSPNLDSMVQQFSSALEQELLRRQKEEAERKAREQAEAERQKALADQLAAAKAAEEQAVRQAAEAKKQAEAAEEARKKAEREAAEAKKAAQQRETEMAKLAAERAEAERQAALRKEAERQQAAQAAQAQAEKRKQEAARVEAEKRKQEAARTEAERARSDRAVPEAAQSGDSTPVAPATMIAAAEPRPPLPKPPPPFPAPRPAPTPPATAPPPSAAPSVPRDLAFGHWCAPDGAGFDLSAQRWIDSAASRERQFPVDSVTSSGDVVTMRWRDGQNRPMITEFKVVASGLVQVRTRNANDAAWTYLNRALSHCAPAPSAAAAPASAAPVTNRLPPP